MLNVRQNFFCRALIAALHIAGPAMAQAPQFDVASVKPSPTERPNFPFHIGPGSFSMQGRLIDLIMQAYEVKYWPSDQYGVEVADAHDRRPT